MLTLQELDARLASLPPYLRAYAETYRNQLYPPPPPPVMPPPPVPLPHRFAPRSYQRGIPDAWDQGIRRFLTAWHRRSGKDTTLLNFCIARMMERVGNYFHIFPQQNQGKRIIWTGINREGMAVLAHFPPELVYKKNESDMTIVLRHPERADEPGSTYQILGTDRNLDVLVGANPVGVIFSEYALQNPRAWDLCRPILRENGGWACFAYTPRGKNHGYRLYTQNRTNPDWYVSLLTVEETYRDGPQEAGGHVITGADLDADRAEGMDEALIQQEYYCSFDTAMPGAYYVKEFLALEQERRITKVPYDPAYGVYTFWDIGVDDATAIWWVQFIGRQVCVIGYHQDTGHGLPHYATLITEKPYQYRAHFFPHDGRVHDWGTGVRRVDTAETLLPGKVEIAPSLSLADGIAACRLLFPRVLIDEVACEQGIEALRSYHHEWDEEKRIFKAEPAHDWASDGADSWRMLAVSLGRVEALEKAWRQGNRTGEVPAAPVDGLWADDGRGTKYGWMG